MSALPTSPAIEQIVSECRQCVAGIRGDSSLPLEPNYNALRLAQHRATLAWAAKRLQEGAGPNTRDQHREGWLCAADFLAGPQKEGL